MRGIAATGIVAFHVAILGQYTGNNAIFDRTIGRGDCFVRMFFLLSGFSLMNAYHKKLLNRSFDIIEYLSARALRVFPLFLITMLAHCVLNIIQGSTIRIAEIVGTGSMLFALMPSHQDPLVWAGWSMGIQMVFYLVFPVFLAICETRKRTWMVFFFSCFLLWAYLDFYSINVDAQHINIIRQFVYFPAGALLFHYKSSLNESNKKDRIITVVICLLVELICFGLFTHIQDDITMIFAFSAWTIMQLINADRITSCNLFCGLGKISYEIYLIHMLIYRVIVYFSWLMNAIYNMPFPIAYTIHFGIVYVLTICIACLYTKFYRKIISDRGV